MLKKGIALGSICVIICAVFSCSVAAQKTNVTHGVGPRGDFGLQSVIFLSWDANQTSEPLDPYGTPRIITLDIAYSVVHGILGQFILWYYIFIQKSINVTVEVIEKPDYCNAVISNSQLWFLIDDTITVEHTNLAVSVNEYAPAFEPFSVKIKASVDDVFGPFGFLRIIAGFEVTQDIIFEAGYRPLIHVTAENSYIETTPGTTIIDPITVENLGNGKTIVYADLIDVPQNWFVIIDSAQLILEVNESKVMNLSITPPIDFYGIETIRLSFTPKFYNNPIYEGTPSYITIAVNVRP